MSAAEPLTRQQEVLLRFAARHVNTRGVALERAVFEAFSVGLVTYFQRLHQLVQLPAAEAIDPLTVRRYRRLVEQRQARLGLRAGADVQPVWGPSDHADLVARLASADAVPARPARPEERS